MFKIQCGVFFLKQYCESTLGDEAVAIVLNPGKQQDKFRGEMFCWNELPELLLVDDLFDSQKDHLRPIPTIIAEDDEDEEESFQ